MGAHGGCGCGAAGAGPCRCERSVVPPDGILPLDGPAAAPALPRGPVAAAGTPQPYTRFDLFEETRRRGFLVAFPDDPSRPPATTPSRPRPAVVEPAAHPSADGMSVVGPRFDAPAPRRPEEGPVAPEGAPLDIERFVDVASPEGVVVPFDAAWPGDRPLATTARVGTGPEGPADPLQPPEYLGTVGGPEERQFLDTSPPVESRRPPPPPPPEPPGFATPQAPREGEPVAPGQQPCTEHAHYAFPPAQQFLFTPEPPDVRGGGGGGEEPALKLDALAAGPKDPCPCKCECVRVANLVSVFVEAGRLFESLFDLFGRARGFLGAPAKPALVISTPDGFVEHVRDLVTRRDVVRYGRAATHAPGSAAPSDGVTATISARAPAAASSQMLLWPELDGTLAAEIRVAPVGPGPGIPGIGAAALVPADGSSLRAAPGSLFAGLAPARDAFGPGVGAAR